MTTEPERMTDDEFDNLVNTTARVDSEELAEGLIAERLARDEAWTLAWIGRRLSATLRERADLDDQFEAMRKHYRDARAQMDREIGRLDRAVKDLLLSRREINPDGPKSLTVLGVGKFTGREVPYGFEIDEREVLATLPPEAAGPFTREVTRLDTAAFRGHLMAMMKVAEPEIPKDLHPEEKAERLRRVADALVGSIGASGVEFRPGRLSLKGPLD